LVRALTTGAGDPRVQDRACAQDFSKTLSLHPAGPEKVGVMRKKSAPLRLSNTVGVAPLRLSNTVGVAPPPPQ